MRIGVLVMCTACGSAEPAVVTVDPNDGDNRAIAGKIDVK